MTQREFGWSKRSYLVAGMQDKIMVQDCNRLKCVDSLNKNKER